MAPIKLQRIVTCSSEDPAFPAENLLKSGTTHRWKCKGGEKSATVVIQLEKSSIISGIDIGNESSAFIEVLVGRESVPDEFKVILLTSSFMSPMDARKEEQTNRVRIFRQEHLHQPECTEKWDRIKVVCTQPFNKFLKYGLAFITLHKYEPAPEVSAPNLLGRFALKDDDNDISVGSIFARRKEEPEPDPQPPSAARSWRDAAKASASHKDHEKKKAAKKNVTPKGDSDRNTPTSKDKPKRTPDNKGSNEHKDTPSTKKESGKKKEHKAGSPMPRTPTSKRPNPEEHSSSGREKKQMKLNPNVTYKPFNKLLEDVEFAISGYVNPGRAEIRSKALEMGAKYRADWTSTCTHLICAFANTPKFQHVKGKGKIVIRDWIDDCHRERKQLQWRRYAVDKADQAGTSNMNEKEVWELVQNTNEASAAQRRNALSSQDTSTGIRAPDSSSDTEDEIERIVQKRKIEAAKVTPNGKPSSDMKKPEPEESNAKPERVEKRGNLEDAIFDVSTDEETGSESNQSKGRSNGLPELPSIFKNKFFYLHPSLSKSQIERVERYIIAFCGTLCEILDENVHFVIAEKKDDNDDDAPGVFYVKPDWIWECNDAGRIVPFRDHEL